MKNVAAHSHGNILSFDGFTDGFDKTFKQMQLINKSLLEKIIINWSF
jgi:hypothetical protein